MAYIGTPPDGQQFYTLAIDRFNGTGACTQFTLTRTISNDVDIEVLVNSVQQDPTNSYSVSGTTLTFTEAPSSGTNNITVTYRVPNVFAFRQVQTADIFDAAVTAPKLAPLSITGDKIAANAIRANNIVAGQITGNLMASDSIRGNNIVAGQITGNLIATTAIRGNQIATTTITGNLMADGSISGNNIVANAIRANNIVAGQITGNLIASAALSGNMFTTSVGATAFTANQTFTVANVTNQLQVYGAAWQNVITLADATTITLNLAQTQNFTVTLGGNRTLANATNFQPGQSGMLVVRQDGTGSRTLTFGTGWRFPGNTAPTLTTTASAVDLITFTARDSGNLVAQAVLNVT